MSDDNTALDYDFDAASNGLETVRADVDEANVINKAGAYHCIVQDVELVHPKKGKNKKNEDYISPPMARVKFKCVCTVNGQSPAGATLRHDISFGSWNKEVGATSFTPLTPEQAEFKHRAAIRAGLVKKVKQADGKEVLLNKATNEPNYKDSEFVAMKGRNYIVRVSEETGSDGVKRMRCRFDDFRLVDDPAVRDVPKSLEALRNAGYSNPEALINTEMNDTESASAQPQAAAAGDVEDDF